MTPTKGKFAKITQGAVDLAAVDWNLQIDGKLDDTSNFVSGRLKTGTLDDATLSYTLIEDSDSQTFGTTTLRPAGTATYKLYTNNAQTKYLAAVFMVSTAGVTNQGVNNTLRTPMQASLIGTIDYTNA